MDFEQLAKVWRDDATGEMRRTRVETLSDFRTRATRAEAAARRRFRRAVIVWLLLVPWFGYWGVFGALNGDLLVTIGFAIVAMGCATPAVIFSRTRGSDADPTLAVRAAVKHEIEELRRLDRAVARMIDWAAGCLVVGLPLIFFGAGSSWLRLGVWVFLSIGIALMARRSWRLRGAGLREAIQELEGWIEDLEGG